MMVGKHLKFVDFSAKKEEEKIKDKNLMKENREKKKNLKQQCTARLAE